MKKKELRKSIDILQLDVNTLLEYLEYDGVVWGHADNEDRRMELLDKVENIKRKYKFKKCEKELKYGESYNVGIISFVPFSENYGSGSFGASIITNGEYNNKKSEK